MKRMAAAVLGLLFADHPRARDHRACAAAAGLARLGLTVNAHVPGREVRRLCRIDARGRQLLEAASERLGLSARAYTRILRVARTIADLAVEDDITTSHLAGAIQYRSLDRRSGA